MAGQVNKQVSFYSSFTLAAINWLNKNEMKLKIDKYEIKLTDTGLLFRTLHIDQVPVPSYADSLIMLSGECPNILYVEIRVPKVIQPLSNSHDGRLKMTFASYRCLIFNTICSTGFIIEWRNVYMIKIKTQSLLSET